MNIGISAPPPPAKARRELRQEPRFKLPARLVVDGASFPTVDWSRNGIGFEAPGATLSPGQAFEAELCFDLPGGTLRTPIAAEVRHYDAVSGRGGLSYRAAAAGGPPEVDFVIADYLAGRITVMDGMLTKSDTPRSETRIPVISSGGIGGLLRRSVGLLVITVAGAIAVYYLGSSVYDRLFVFEAVSAQVAFPTVEIDSPVAGTLMAVSPPGSIAAGEPLFKVTDVVGKQTSVPSPCSCDVVAVGERQSGGFVSAGTTVMKLVRNDGTATVSVGVAFPDMRRVYDGAAVDLKYLDGQVVRGAHIRDIRSLGGEQSGLVTLELDPGRPLVSARFGEPVYARFDTAPWRANAAVQTGGQP